MCHHYHHPYGCMSSRVVVQSLWVVLAMVVLVPGPSVVHGNRNGAPLNACGTMTPNHGTNTPQTGDGHQVALETSASSYQPGQVITMTLRRTGGTFKGFLIKATAAGSSSAVGQFSTTDGSGDSLCSSNNGNGVTHVDNLDKSTVALTWTAPDRAVGNVEIMGTIVEAYATFWVRIPLATLTGEGESPDPGSGSVVAPQSINLDGCGNTKGCFRSPNNCASEDCKYLLTWQRDGDGVTYEMSATLDNHQYVAMGLSEDDKMGSDSVTQCVYNEETRRVQVTNSYNSGKQNQALVNPGYGLVTSSLSGGFNEGQITCRFTRHITPVGGDNEDMQRVFALDARQYKILMVKGAASGEHMSPHAFTDVVTSDVQVDFNSQQYVAIGGSGADYSMVKAHACLMILAWMICASVGVLLPRHFKPLWPNTKINDIHLWFQLHRALMVTVFLTTIIAFIIIFVEVEGYSNLKGKPDNSHAPLGIAVTVLAVANPIISIFRCGPKDSKRPIFNWVHFLVGTGAHVGGVVNIFIGTYLGKAQAPSSTRIILIIFVVVHVLTEAFFYIYAWCQKSKKESKEMEMREPGAATPLSGEKHVIETVVLVIYALVTAILGIVLIGILAAQ